MIQRILTSYKVNFLVWETVAAFLVGALIVGYIEIFWSRHEFIQLIAERRDTLYGSVSGISGSLLGFSITLLTVVIAFVSGPEFSIVRNSPYHRDIYNVFLAAIKAYGVTTLLALLGLFIDDGRDFLVWIPYLLTVMIIWSITRTTRQIWLLSKIIEIKLAGDN